MLEAAKRALERCVDDAELWDEGEAPKSARGPDVNALVFPEWQELDRHREIQAQGPGVRSQHFAA